MSISIRRRHIAYMLVLTFSSGIIDAIGFLALGRVFPGNMTGNVAILGVTLSGASEHSALRPALAFVFFLLGAALAGAYLRRAHRIWSFKTTTTLALVGLGMLATAVYTFIAGIATDHAFNGLSGHIITALLAFFMGAQGAAGRRVDINDINTIVVTSTIVGLGADMFTGENRRQATRRRALAVFALLAGAFTGGFCLMVSPEFGILVTALLTIGVAVAGDVGRRRYRRQRRTAVEL